MCVCVCVRAPWGRTHITLQAVHVYLWSHSGCELQKAAAGGAAVATSARGHNSEAYTPPARRHQSTGAFYDTDQNIHILIVG